GRRGGRGARRRAQGPPVLLRAGARRGDRAGRGPDAPAGGGGPDLPGGVVPARRRGTPVPARPGARGQGAQGGGRGAAGGGARRRRQRPLPALAHGSAGGERTLTGPAPGGGGLPVRGDDGPG